MRRRFKPRPRSTSDSKMGTVVLTLPDGRRYGVSGRTGWPGVSDGKRQAAWCACLASDRQPGVHVVPQTVSLVCMSCLRQSAWCACRASDSQPGVHVVPQTGSLVCMSCLRQAAWCACRASDRQPGVHVVPQTGSTSIRGRVTLGHRAVRPTHKTHQPPL